MTLLLMAWVARWVLPLLVIGWIVGFIALVIYAMAIGPIGECIPGADPAIRLARCADVQP